MLTCEKTLHQKRKIGRKGRCPPPKKSYLHLQQLQPQLKGQKSPHTCTRSSSYEVGFPQGSFTMQSIFLSCVFFPFWTQLENSTTKGEEKKNHVTNSTTKDKWKHLLKSSSLWPLLRTVFFLYFWLPSWNLLKKYSHVILFYSYFILFFRNISNEDHFFPPKKIIFVCVKKIIFYFFQVKRIQKFASTNHPNQNYF